MRKTIREILGLPENVQKYLIGTFYDISVDDGANHPIEIPDEWTEDRLAEAGFIERTNASQYPKIVDEHVVFSNEEAINLDNVAASHAKTLRGVDYMRENATLSTVDAFYSKNQNESYFIEFKNGEWKETEIKDKVFESIALLNDLKILDKYAIITGNRTKDTVEVCDLYLSEKMKAYCGLEETADFYKEKVQLFVIYSGIRHIIRHYLDLCRQRDKYDWIEKKLREADLLCLRRMKPEDNHLNFGYEMVNRLGMLLVTANSANRNLERYLKVEEMLNRMEKIEQNKPEIEKTCCILDAYEDFVSFLYLKMYDDDKKAETFRNVCCQKEVLHAKAFLKLTAKMSVERMFRHENEEKDDYDIVMEIANCLESIKEECFNKIIVELYREVEGELPELEIRKEEICDKSFTDLHTLLEQHEYDELIKRSILIQRITKANDTEELEEETKTKMLKHVCGMDEDLAERISKITEGKSKLFVLLIILWNYLYKETGIRNDAEQDSYIHMMRQMKYLEVFKNGHRRNQKYGPFAERINEKTKHLIGEEKKKKVLREASGIEHEIVEGKEIRSIMPLQKVVRLTISNEDRKIRGLQSCLKGVVLRDVQGYSAMDFEKILL